MKITQRTYNKNVIKFAKDAQFGFEKVKTFAKKMKMTDKEFDTLCNIVDDYSKMNVGIVEYCMKNDINVDEFRNDIMNY